MLLERQGREREGERERDRERERAAPPPNRRRAMQPVRVRFFDDPVDDAPHQRGRTEVDFDWIRDPGQWNLAVSWMQPDSE